MSLSLAVSADFSLGRLVDRPEFVLLSCLLASQQYDTCWYEAECGLLFNIKAKGRFEKMLGQTVFPPILIAIMVSF